MPTNKKVQWELLKLECGHTLPPVAITIVDAYLTTEDPEILEYLEKELKNVENNTSQSLRYINKILFPPPDWSKTR